MQINHCIASKPGLYENKEIDLSGSITVIYGRNDSGKSLLARAILDILWGSVSEASLLKKDAWKDLFIEVQVANCKRNYKFRRNAEKTFSIQIIEDSQQREILNKKLNGADPEEVKKQTLWELSLTGDGEELLNHFLGRDSKAVLTLSFIPSPVNLENNALIEYKHFKQILLEDCSNFYSLFKRINESFKKKKFDNKYNNTVLNEILSCERKIKELDKQIQIIDIKNSKLKKLTKEKESVLNEIDDLNIQLTSLRDRKGVISKIIENNSRCEENIELVKKLNDEINIEVEKNKKAENLEKVIIDSFPQFQDFNDKNKQNLRKIQDVYREFRDFNEKFEEYLSRMKGKQKRIKNVVVSIVISSIVAILLSIKNIFIKFSENNKLFFIIALSGLSLLSILFLIMTFVLKEKTKRYKDLLNIRDSIELKLKEIFQENKIELSEFKLESIYEFLLQYFEEFGEYSEKQLELYKLKNQQKEAGYIDKIRKHLIELKKEEKDIKKIIEDDIKTVFGNDGSYADKGNLNFQINKINNEIKDLKGHIEDREKILSQIVEEIKQHKDQKGKKIKLLERKNELANILDKLYNHREAMKYTLEIFSEAIDKREKEQLQKLICLARDNFNFLTNNQYISLIDNDHIKNFIEKNEIDERFNNTTIYLMLVSVKIALSEFLNENGAQLPLIIDEPFLYMDDVRAQKFKKLISDISSIRQIIIFTHNNNYSNWGNYVEL